MKKRIGVILVLMMMLWGTPVFGEELTIDSLRFVKSDFLVEERCIIEGCEYSIDEYVDIIDLQELEVGRKDIKNTISTLGGWCQNHTMRENFFATDLKAVYTEEEAGLLHINWDGKSEILENRVSALTLEDYRSRKSSNACEDCGRYLPRATANLFLSP